MFPFGIVFSLFSTWDFFFQQCDEVRIVFDSTLSFALFVCMYALTYNLTVAKPFLSLTRCAELFFCLFLCGRPPPKKTQLYGLLVIVLHQTGPLAACC